MMKKIIAQLAEIENLKPFSHKNAPEISEASIGWHLEHSLLVISRILEGLPLSHPEKYQPKFSLAKFMVMTSGYIPRKKGKAPKFTIPTSENFLENIDNYLNSVRENLQMIKNLPSQSYIEHPYFGHLDVKQTLKFLKIHTQHHLKIAKEILAKSH
ncbi:MAG: DUF1569 domain-containing protein [Cloacibacterium sp.]|uniref:DUF1569 domain-containing protein n=1 Tax=Cloacibacterium sp. TaxID=1913682 RepID=UPI003C739A78